MKHWPSPLTPLTKRDIHQVSELVVTPMLSLVFILVLLATQRAPGCRIAPSTECQNAPFVPGHNLVGEGFNIVQMKTTGAYVVNIKNYMNGGQHGNCTICMNKLVKQEQKLPSAVVDWRVKVRCKRSLSAKVFESTSSVLKESSRTSTVGWKVGLNIPMSNGLAVGGTHSKSVKFAQRRSSQDKFSYTSHEFSCRYYSFRLHARPSLTKEFIGSLQALPAQYNTQTKAAYEHFISIYGTHFLRRVDLGGHVRSTTAVRTCKVAMSGLTVQDVSNCLSAEASVVIQGVPVKGQTSYCNSKRKKLENESSFSASFSDRITEIMGGDGEQADILFAPDKVNGYRAWLKTLKDIPGVVSYSLTSLHMLVGHDSARRESLRNAISQYVMKSAVSLSCSSKCNVGRRVSNCVCKCSGHQSIDANCCPSQPGVASLSVTVLRAAGLWGDYFSKTDGYVKVFFGKEAGSTSVIWNNNFPAWNYLIQFGTVDLRKKQDIKFEVWDRDNRWDDDLLGRFTIIPNKGRNMPKQFRLKHGTLFVSISAICGPNLDGQLCEKYVPNPEGSLNYLEPLINRWPSMIQGPYSTSRNDTFL